MVLIYKGNHKVALCKVWLKLAQWFWKRRYLNFINVFMLMLISLLSPLGKGCGPSFEQTCIFFTQGPKDALCQVWLKLAQWFWRRRENVKILRCRKCDLKLTWAFDSGELIMCTAWSPNRTTVTPPGVRHKIAIFWFLQIKLKQLFNQKTFYCTLPTNILTKYCLPLCILVPLIVLAKLIEPENYPR